jgi:hypothetical protein
MDEKSPAIPTFHTGNSDPESPHARLNDQAMRYLFPGDLAPHPSAWPRPKTPCQRSRQASGYPPADRAMSRKGKSVSASPASEGGYSPMTVQMLLGRA